MKKTLTSMLVASMALSTFATPVLTNRAFVGLSLADPQTTHLTIHASAQNTTADFKAPNAEAILFEADNLTRQIILTKETQEPQYHFGAINGTQQIEVLIGGIQAGTYDVPYFAVAIMDLATEQVVKPTLQDGQVVLTMGTGTTTLEGSFVTVEGQKYVLKLSGDYLNGDVADGNGITKTIGADAICEIQQDMQYNAFLVQIVTDKEMLGLAFNVTADQMKKGNLPAGEYPIGFQYKPGTVDGNIGMYGGSIMPSFYGTIESISGSNISVEDIYMFVDGKVVVEYNDANQLKIIIDVVNSYDLPIKVIYDASVTALDHASENEQATKFVGADGQLYIRRGNHTYTATGALIE